MISLEKMQKCARPRRYADGKPRPLFRGVIHVVQSVVIVGCLVAGTAAQSWTFALALVFKLLTYAASATFHIYPFSSVAGVTNAFIADLLCVPCTAIGAVTAFVPEADGAIIAREAGIAVTTLALNALAVLYQTRGQIGLQTRVDRTDAPRSVITGAYSIWAFTFVGLSSGFDELWGAMVGLTVAAVLLSTPVTKAHEEEPTLTWPARPVWHVKGVWSLHEDFHLILAGADVVWLLMVLRRRALYDN